MMKNREEIHHAKHSMKCVKFTICTRAAWNLRSEKICPRQWDVHSMVMILMMMVANYLVSTELTPTK